MRALLRIGHDLGCEMAVVAAVDRTNEMQKRSLVPRIEAYLGGLAGRVVAWGYSRFPCSSRSRSVELICKADIADNSRSCKPIEEILLPYG